MSTGLTTTPRKFFKHRPFVPTIRPSQILQLWDEVRPQFASRGVDVLTFDPAYHPAPLAELGAWLLDELSTIQTDLRALEQAHDGDQRALLDCDDSAFLLKSRASGQIRSLLSAPLPVGILCCRRKSSAKEHIINWFVSADQGPARKRPGPKKGEPQSDDQFISRTILRLWFLDVRRSLSELGKKQPNGQWLEGSLLPISKLTAEYDDISLILA